MALPLDDCKSFRKKIDSRHIIIDGLTYYYNFRFFWALQEIKSSIVAIIRKYRKAYSIEEYEHKWESENKKIENKESLSFKGSIWNSGAGFEKTDKEMLPNVSRFEIGKSKAYFGSHKQQERVYIHKISSCGS